MNERWQIARLMQDMGRETTSPRTAEREKAAVALNSMLAAILLTSFKVVVGFATGSLGILAEAVHSALDLGAATLTYVAVRISAKPPDETHLYGHGKVESFSALAETFLLLVTCVWIIYEAVQRLFFKDIHIEPSLWAFGVMFLSIVIDYSRSRALMRVARRYQSQALEADALHFSTDIWSSSVVIGGLTLVRIGKLIGREALLVRADALAALGVALIVLWVSARLGKATVDVLVDRAPTGLAPRIRREIRQVPGVVDCGRVRVRRVGPAIFVDMVVGIRRAAPLEQAHATASQVEARVQQLLPQADVVIHMEPVASPEESWPERIQTIAGQQGLTIHEVRVHEVGSNDLSPHYAVTLHLEVDQSLSLAEAHAVADRLEEAIRAQLDDTVEVNTHIEPRTDQSLPVQEAPDQLPAVLRELEEIARGIAVLRDYHDVSVRRVDQRLFVSLHCTFDGGLSIEDVHLLSSRIENRLKARLTEIEGVHIHVEPPAIPAERT